MGTIGADFNGDVAVVTGAASGIGREVVGHLWRAGASVHGFDVQPVNPEDLELPGGKAPPRFHELDVRDTQAVESVHFEENTEVVEGCLAARR